MEQLSGGIPNLFAFDNCLCTKETITERSIPLKPGSAGALLSDGRVVVKFMQFFTEIPNTLGLTERAVHVIYSGSLSSEQSIDPIEQLIKNHLGILKIKDGKLCSLKVSEPQYESFQKLLVQRLVLKKDEQNYLLDDKFFFKAYRPFKKIAHDLSEFEIVAIRKKNGTYPKSTETYNYISPIDTLTYSKNKKIYAHHRIAYFKLTLKGPQLIVHSEVREKFRTANVTRIVIKLPQGATRLIPEPIADLDILPEMIYRNMEWKLNPIDQPRQRSLSDSKAEKESIPTKQPRQRSQSVFSRLKHIPHLGKRTEKK